MLKTQIIGTGSYAPDQVVTNQDLEKRVETSDKWIIERTGIKERRIAAPDQASSDLATKAAIQALEMAKTRAEDLDMIIIEKFNFPTFAGNADHNHECITHLLQTIPDVQFFELIKKIKRLAQRIFCL